MSIYKWVDLEMMKTYSKSNVTTLFVTTPINVTLNCNSCK